MGCYCGRSLRLKETVHDQHPFLFRGSTRQELFPVLLPIEISITLTFPLLLYLSIHRCTTLSLRLQERLASPTFWHSRSGWGMEMDLRLGTLVTRVLAPSGEPSVFSKALDAVVLVPGV